MGRRLHYRFADHTEVKDSGDSVYYDKRPELDWEYPVEHQRKNHDLPYQETFTYDEMVEGLKKYILEREWYEASVFVMILDNWSGDICVFRYD